MDASGFRMDMPADCALKVRRVRAQFGFTQQQLAERLGVSFATVNRWENEQAKPSALSWQRFESLARELSGDLEIQDEEASVKPEEQPLLLDFTGKPEVVRTLAEGERLSFGHMANPTFATEVSLIDPLPHQRIAVYDYMLKKPRLRFLLADDAGAGKTIMSGLYVREMLSRRLFRRVLVVPPAGLVGNWESELATLFNMPFRIIEGSDVRVGNPFVGDDSNRVIVSVDTLAGPRVFSRLQEPDVQPYDLVIFDEAHKLSADRGADLRVRKTDRYRLAEALAGVRGLDSRWCLGWSAHHLLLLTATPHMGKDYPYYALWRLLEPEVLPTPEAFVEYPRPQRRHHFVRRTKEEMVRLDGSPLYPTRISDTLGYPVLFRGGMAWGEVCVYEAPALVAREVVQRHNLVGKAVVEAVGLEQAGAKGPVLLCSEPFAARLSMQAKDYLRQITVGNKNLLEICWPAALCETATSLSDALLNDFGWFFHAVLNLLKFFAGGHLEVHYLELARLTIRSGLLRFPSDRAALEKHVERAAADVSLVKSLLTGCP